MSKDPAFLFYSSDFLTGTCCMSNEQKGKYITLMCLQHQKGHLSEKDMNKICGDYDEDIFDKFTKDEEGKFYNERLEEEIQKRKKYSESRRLNRQGKIKDKDDTPPKAEKQKKEEIDFSKEFQEFYAQYPRKVAKQNALKAYKKAIENKISPEMILSGVQKYKEYIAAEKIDNQYIKHPASWLNSCGWEDEYEIKRNTSVGFY